MKPRIFIFGAGYSAKVIARLLAPEAEAIFGTTRNAEGMAELAAAGIRPVLYTGEGLGSEIKEALATASHLILSIAPGEEGDPVLADIAAEGGNLLPDLRWIGYLSTVGVYGHHDCAWVDETSDCHPASARSQRRLEAEKGWIAFGRERECPVAILRLAGIYGSGRNAFRKLANGTARRVIKPGQVFNRVHVEDIASSARHLIRRNAAGIFNIVDDEPSPPQDAIVYAARLMGVEPPPEVSFEEAQLTSMARSFYSECKRASNRKLKETGYVLLHPDYREALTKMWESGDW